MANLHEIIQWCDQTLKAAEFKDYAPNGLQIEGSTEVKRIVCAVTVIFGKANRILLLVCEATALKNSFKIIFH